MDDRGRFISESRKEADISLIKKYLAKLDEASPNLDEKKTEKVDTKSRKFNIYL